MRGDTGPQALRMRGLPVPDRPLPGPDGGQHRHEDATMATATPIRRDQTDPTGDRADGQDATAQAAAQATTLAMTQAAAWPATPLPRPVTFRDFASI